MKSAASCDAPALKKQGFGASGGRWGKAGAAIGTAIALARNRDQLGCESQADCGESLYSSHPTPHWARGHGRLRVPAVPIPRAHTSFMGPVAPAALLD